MTTLTISLPESLKAQLEAAAVADNRSVSNLAVVKFRQWLQQSGQADLRVAEQAEAYGSEQIDEATSKLGAGKKNPV